MEKPIPSKLSIFQDRTKPSIRFCLCKPYQGVLESFLVLWDSHSPGSIYICAVVVSGFFFGL